MRILYVTRHFNHSGYIILQRLLKEEFDLVGILLKKEKSPYKDLKLRWLYIGLYKLKTFYYRGKHLKTVRSEELLARKNRLNLILEESIKSDSFYLKLKNLNPDIIVLGGGWHELIPARVFNYPRLGCINTHPSLLPEFRGTSITRWQVLHGVSKSGSTIHFVDGNFDTGGALAQKEIEISKDMAPQDLFFELGNVGADLMVELLRKFESGIVPKPFFPDHNAKYYSYFKRWQWNLEKLKINWSLSLRDIHFFVLANSQESYEYLAPHFSCGGNEFFVRETKFFEVGADQEIEFANNQVHVVQLKNESVILGKRHDPHVLEVRLVQRFDKYYKFRRARKPSRIIKLKLGDIIS